MSTTTSLAAQQDSLLQALLGPWRADALADNAMFEAAHPTRGLQAYRSNAHSLAERALQAAYPVVAQLLGADNFAALAREHWHAQPPTCGDLAQWGAQLPVFLAQHPQLQAEGFLPDVARLEWLLHTCASAADEAPDMNSFGLLATQDPEQLHLQLAPGCAVLPSPWPVVSLWQAHQHSTPELSQAHERMQQSQGETALIWRQGFKPMLRALDPQEATWLQALLQGQTLPKALQAAGEFDFNHWLVQAVQSGLALRIHSPTP